MVEKVCVSSESISFLGRIEENFISFKGIPYAKAGRFKAPEPVSLEGKLDCGNFGKKAMQVFDRPAPWAKPQTREEFDEECLNLNIYIPRRDVPLNKDGTVACEKMKTLPVLVDIHGGGFQGGSNQEHTPEEMVKDHDYIYVAMNYRLGIFGFLYLGDILGEEWADSGNCGVMDIMAAICWVYKNIQSFGGDPQRITVLGSSAGAKCMGALMLRPEFKAYVHQVIMASGACQSIRDRHTAAVIAQRYMTILEKKSDREQSPKQLLLEGNSDLLLEAQKELTDVPGNTCMFGPVADGIFLPDNCDELIKKGTLWEGRAMIGSSRHEQGLLQRFDKNFLDNAAGIAQNLFGRNSAIACEDFEILVQDYFKIHGNMPSDDEKARIWVRILSDYMYRTYSYRLAARLAGKGCAVWQYSVEFEPALHCFDQMLAFRNLSPAFFDGEEHIAKARLLGNAIFEAFAGFIEHGQPGGTMPWPCLDTEEPQQMYWDEQSYIDSVPKDDVLNRIGESVFIL